LFDVKLQVSEGIIAGPSFVDSLRIQTKRRDRISDHREQLIVNISNQRAASDEWHAKSHTFLFRESDHFNLKRQEAPVETLDQSNSEDHAQDSIEGSRMGNGIEMRTNEQPWCAWPVGWMDAPKISGMIHAHAHPRHFHPAAQTSMHLVHRLGQESSRRCAGLFAELRQKAASFDYIHHEPRYVL
jgi:hypothetical protein